MHRALSLDLAHPPLVGLQGAALAQARAMDVVARPARQGWLGRIAQGDAGKGSRFSVGRFFRARLLGDDVGERGQISTNSLMGGVFGDATTRWDWGAPRDGQS